MSQKQNLLVFAILVAFLGVLSLLIWSVEPEAPEANSLSGAETEAMEAGSTALPEAKAEDLAEGQRLAEGDAAGRSTVENLAPAVDANSILLTGRLLQESRQPAAEVGLSFRPQVHIQLDDLEDITSLREFSPADMERRMDEQSVNTESGLDGRFSIRVPVNQKGGILLSEESNILFAEQEQRYHPIAGFTKDVDLGDLVLIPGASLSGLVTDARGQGVEGVSINMAGVARFADMGSRGGIKTDADGRFEFGSLRPGKHSLSTTASGFVPTTKALELAKGEARGDFVIQLESGASISGTVLSDEGKPIEGAKVAFYRKRQAAGNVSISRFDDREAVETDENGFFSLGGIESEAVVLRAWADGHGEQQIENVQIGASSVVFHLTRHGSISGVLVDSQGEPIAGSKVWVKKDRGLPGLQLFESLAEARSAADGSFVLEGVPAGDVLVTADGDLHRPVEAQTVNMPAAGQVNNLRLVAETGAVLEVLVVDAGGEPVAGAKVTVREYQEAGVQGVSGSFQTRDVRAVRRGGGGGETFIMDGSGGSLGKGTTDEDGLVRIAGLPESMVSIEAEHGSMVSPADARTELSSTQIVETTLKMKPGGFITVHTLDANGEPRPETDFEINGPLIAGESEERKSGKSNGEGVATIGPFVAGSYRAVLSHDSNVRYSPGGGMDIRIGGAENKTLRDSEQSVLVKAGETVELSLVRPILTHLSGVLSNATGPVAGARVALRDAESPSLPFGNSSMSAKTDRDGHFSIEDLQAGTYTLEYGREGALIMHEEELIIPPAQAELARDLTLRGGSLRVTVVDDMDGMPVERAKVALRRPGEAGGSGGGRSMNVMMVTSNVDSSGPSNTTVEVGGGASTVSTDEDGVALLEDIPPGDYVLEIKHTRFADQKIEEIKVTDGRVTEQGKVSMSPAGFIRGSVTGFGEDAGMRMALVRLKQVGSDAEPKRQPAINGSFSFDGLRPGMYELSAKRLGIGGGNQEWGTSQIVEVVAGKRVRPQLELPPK